VAGPGVADVVGVADALGLVEGDGLGEVEGFEREVYANIPPMIMMITTIAAAIMYVFFIFSIPSFEK
jgi:hypothetical protein